MSWKYPYWYEKNFRLGKKRAARPHKIPVDTHAMIALQAPRPVMVMAGIRDYLGSTGKVYKGVKLPNGVGLDIEGGFDAAWYAGKVYELYNPKWGFDGDRFSATPEDQIISSRVGWSLDPYGHDMSGEDWLRIRNFAEKWGLND